jgi:hypothetical protein
MRALLVLGLTLFHTARIFDLLPFYIKNEHQSLVAMAFVGFVSQWGMPLFFVIAGIAAWHSLKKRTAIEFVVNRFRRLIIPFIFGIFVLVPPQHYYALRTNPEYHETYWQFYPSFFRVTLRPDFPEFIRADPEVGIYGPGHLWFLYYLFAFTMVALPLFIYLRRAAGVRLIYELAGFCQKPGAILLLAIPLIVVETLILTEESTGWNRFAYLPLLICGFLFAADARFEQSLYRHRYAGLIGGTLLVAGFFAVTVGTHQAGIDPSAGWGWQNILWRLLKSCSAFFWIVAILGWAQAYLRRHARLPKETHQSGEFAPDQERTGPPASPDRLQHYVNEAVMPFYILHQTVIVVIGFYVVNWPAGVAIKYFVIVGATLAITLALFEAVIRRTKLMRFLFGMKLSEDV